MKYARGTVAGVALAGLLAGAHATARSLNREDVRVDLRTFAVVPMPAAPPSPPASGMGHAPPLDCREHASATFAVHGGAVEIREAGRVQSVRFTPANDTRNRITWFYAQGGIAVVAVRTFHPGNTSDDGHDELVAADIATGRPLWSRSLTGWAPDCYVAGPALAISHGPGLELNDPRTGATVAPPVAVTGWPAGMVRVAADRLLYYTDHEMVMLDANGFRAVWRAPMDDDQDVLVTPTAVLTVSLRRTGASAEASLVSRDLATGALAHTTLLTRYSRFFDSMRSNLVLRAPGTLDVGLSFVVLD